MIDLFRLSGVRSIERIVSADVFVATLPDGQGSGADEAKAHVSGLKVRVTEALKIREVLDLRLPPQVPAPKTLQDLVRAGRRRLADDRRREEKAVLVARDRHIDTLLGKL